MKSFIKSYWKTLLFFMVIGLVGGFLTGLYIMDTYPIDIQQQLLDQGINNVALALLTAIQSVGYALFCGVIGIFLGKKVGLWKDETDITSKALKVTLIVALIGGLSIILFDVFIFNNYSEVIKHSYDNKPTIIYTLASVLYGGIIEEVMLRLFFMSLIAFILNKLFNKKSEKASSTILLIANIIAAILFAAGHLPATLQTIGDSPIIIFRCFLLNGGIGFLFGYLYSNYGLRYSMIAHAGTHIVSKLIWILFI